MAVDLVRSVEFIFPVSGSFVCRKISWQNGPRAAISLGWCHSHDRDDCKRKLCEIQLSLQPLPWMNVFYILHLNNTFPVICTSIKPLIIGSVVCSGIVLELDFVVRGWLWWEGHPSYIGSVNTKYQFDEGEFGTVSIIIIHISVCHGSGVVPNYTLNESLVGLVESKCGSPPEENRIWIPLILWALPLLVECECGPS